MYIYNYIYIYIYIRKTQVHKHKYLTPTPQDMYIMLRKMFSVEAAAATKSVFVYVLRASVVDPVVR